jgi:hypothetical protein
MMSFFLIVLAVSVVVPAGAFIFLKGVNWKEAGCILLANIVIAGSSAGIVSCSAKHDVEILNGRVTSKTRDVVSCRHSYSCNCRQECSGSGKNRSCSQVCDTCYEHSFDVDWDVASTVGGFSIDTIDRQGLREPPRWTSTRVGEPVSVTHSYENYVKASPGTLFRHQGLTEKYATTLPNNPQNIYDYWHLNRLVTVGISVDDPRGWNAALEELNAELGAPKQANIIVVLVKDQPQDWYYALEQKWIGGKKNDVVLVVGVDGDLKPQWATVMCWTTNEIFKVKLRDDVMNDPVLTKDAVIADLKTNVSQYFVRKPMADFQYLESEMTPSTTAWVVTLIIALIVSIGLTVFFELEDPFEEGDEDDFGYAPKRRRNRYGYGTSGSGPY